jgi:hypothetical protein
MVIYIPDVSEKENMRQKKNSLSGVWLVLLM